MPLDQTKGEVIEGFDPIFRVVPLSKYAEQTRLTTVVQRMSTGKFKRKVDVVKPIWIAAREHAAQAFANSGADAGSLAFDVLVQEYPRTGVVNFIFNATLSGQEMYVSAPFKLTEEQIADLTVRNLWQPYTIN
jgi:hypothetical protein